VTAINPVPDAIFPHTPELEIPILAKSMEADYVDLPVRGWGSVARRTRFEGTWHFYTDDYKFDTLWKKPATLLNTKAVNFVEPNFSTDIQMPYPVVLYRIYQKRWLSRYWQSQGLRCWVDLSVAPNWEGVNLYGVPRGWQSYATAANDNRLEDLLRHSEIAKEHAMGNEVRLLVYGGGKKTAEACAANDWVHVRDARNEARNG
jgi:hypothetical protein